MKMRRMRAAAVALTGAGLALGVAALNRPGSDGGGCQAAALSPGPVVAA